VIESPSGTVTFLFTDIEGSTSLWEERAEDMAAALARHDAVLREAIAGHGGVVFSTGGDGLGAVFARAPDGVAAACDAQRLIGSEAWPGRPLRVRMALHTGDAEERDGDYFGPPVNRCARLMAAAHGGQVLCSGVTAALVAGRFPEGVSLMDLGQHRLRDLSEPEHVFQLVHPELAHGFPPLRSLSAFPGNLPVQVTGFVGRDQELGECTGALQASRVVTVTGVGGVGKTRFALQVAAEVLPRFADGAWVVEFAGVGDPAMVEEATATALGVQARPNQPLATTLSDFLRTKRLLLVLDNCEHLVGAMAALVERVLAGCPDVVVVATSREGLAVSGEHLVPLPPMQLPAGDTLDVVAGCEAVRLFVARAGDVRPGFSVTPENAAKLAQLCRRLDGIPLALELAAARVRSMSLADILSHLDHRFRLLTGGRRSALSRQQTLRGAIDWSYDLLDDPERMVLRRLAVFAGGFDLAAAETVGEGGSVDAFDVAVHVDRLVDKSLVVADPSGPSSRFRLLEMIRDYTWDRLGESGETEDVSRRHAEFFVAFAAAADRGLRGPDELSWTERIERELDNLRAAVSWAVEAGQPDAALEIIASLSTAFGTRIGAPFGPMAEKAAAMPQALGHPLRCVALASAARAARDRGDRDRARDLADSALEAVAALPPGRASARARCRTFSGVFFLLQLGQHARFREVARARFTAAMELDDPWEQFYGRVGVLPALGESDPSRAIVQGEENLRLARELGNPSMLAYATMLLAALIAKSEPIRAEALLEEAIGMADAMRNDFAGITARMNLGFARAARGEHLRAADAYLSAAELASRVGDRFNVFAVLGALACDLAELGDHEPALVLATWSANRGHWPEGASVGLSGKVRLVQSRLRDVIPPTRRQELEDRAEAMDDVAAIALARTQVEKSAQE
jgi:predicted ATPase/class 3 adenylate cyclase